MIYFMCKDGYVLYTIADMILWAITIVIAFWFGYKDGWKSKGKYEDEKSD